MMHGIWLWVATSALATSPVPGAWGGGHEIQKTEDGLTIQSRILWSKPSSIHRDAIVPLTVPLPKSARLRGSEVTAVRDGSGQIVALRIVADDAGAASEVLTQVPYEDAGPVAIPIPVGDGIHRVRFLRKWSFEPDPKLGLVTRVGYIARPDLPRARRRPVDATLDGGGYRRPLGAVYIRADDGFITQGGLRGRLVPRRSGGFLGLLGVGFLVVVVGLVGVHRRLTRRARVEAADALLDREWAKIQSMEWPRKDA